MAHVFVPMISYLVEHRHKFHKASSVKQNPRPTFEFVQKIVLLDQLDTKCVPITAAKEKVAHREKKCLSG